MNVPPPLASPSVPPASAWVGYACLAPLGLGLAAIVLGGDPALRELAQRSTLAWGASLLTFTGAVHAGLMFGGRLAMSPQHVSGALLPAVAATVAVLVGGQRGLALLVVGFGLFWLYEHRVLGGELSPDYLVLRRHLSIVACGVLALAMLASDAAGLT
ncbi:MAG: DUF3429 domain-containing protein [Proteobacteria bacterium]|nr:DUF3429 domain-containing protein [Pseudomonadota bacterium]